MAVRITQHRSSSTASSVNTSVISMYRASEKALGRIAVGSDDERTASDFESATASRKPSIPGGWDLDRQASSVVDRPALRGHAITQLAYHTAFDTVLATADRRGRDRLDAMVVGMAADSEFTPVVRLRGCLRGVAR